MCGLFLGDDRVIISSSYVYTTRGCVITSDRILLQVVREEQNEKNENYEANCRHCELREAVENGRTLVAVNFSQRVRKDRMKRMAFLTGIPVEKFRQGCVALTKDLL